MPGTNAKRVVHAYAHHLEAAPERVFPLLCPVREHDWVQGWSFERLAPEAQDFVESLRIPAGDVRSIRAWARRGGGSGTLG